MTDISVTGSYIFSITNSGTGNSFVVNDQASDTTPFVVDAAGNVGIGIAIPTQALDVVGRVTSSSVLLKKVTARRPTGGSGGGGGGGSTVYNAGSATSISFSLGKAQYTSAVRGAFTLSNIADGGSYTLLVTGNGTGPATSTHAGLTVKTGGTLACGSAQMRFLVSSVLGPT